MWGRLVVDLITGVVEPDGGELQHKGYTKLEPCLNLGNLGKPLYFWVLKVSHMSKFISAQSSTFMSSTAVVHCVD